MFYDCFARTLKEQNVVLSRTQQSEDEHRKLLDKIATLRRKLADMEVKYVKIKEEKEGINVHRKIINNSI